MGFLVNEDHHIPDPLDKGFLGFIRRSWNSVVSSTGKFFADGIGKATMTGVGKGLLISFGTIVTAGMVMGALSGQAGMPTPIFGDVGGKVSADFVSGMVNGAYQGMKYAISNPTGIGIVLAGGLVGVATDIRAASQNLETKQAMQRVAVAKGRSVEPSVVPERTQEVSQEPTLDELSHPPTNWAKTMRHDDDKNRGMGR